MFPLHVRGSLQRARLRGPWPRAGESFFVARDGKRKTLRLGRVDKKTAESIRIHVEALLASRISGLPLQQAPAVCLNTTGETLKENLAKVGLECWPRLRHNLRASCESELAQAFPLAMVTKWLGSTPSIALRHYVDPANTAYRLALRWIPKATQDSNRVQPDTTGVQTNSCTESGSRVAQKAAQNVSASSGKIEKSESQDVFNYDVVQCGARCNSLLQHKEIAGAGFEPATSRL